MLKKVLCTWSYQTNLTTFSLSLSGVDEHRADKKRVASQLGSPAASVYLLSGCQRTLPPELGKLRLRLTTA